MTETLPSVLGWVPEPPQRQACHCLCTARHPDKRNVCTGSLYVSGFRVHFNSLYDTEGVVVCLPCGEAMPENLYSL